MWREARLAFTDSVAALNCSIVPAHPWIYGLGQQTANGAYLSPVNAVRYLAERLAGTGGNADVVIMMVTGQTQENFMVSLNNLVGIFPAPAFTQVKRLAQSAAALAIEKMQIPAKSGAALPASIPLSVPTSRVALSAAAISQAQKAAGAGFDIEGLKKQLGEFTQLRDQLISDVVSGLNDLQGKSARAWVFTASGDTGTTFTGYVERSQPAENGFQRLFIRELVLGTATLLAGAIQHVSAGDYSQAVKGNRLASIEGNDETEITGKQSTKVAGAVDVDVGGTLTEKIAALRKSVASGGQQIMGPTVHIGSESVNTLTMMLDTIDLLAELAQQCASHSHPSVGTPTNAGAFTRTATKAGQTRSKYQNIIA